VKAHRTAHGRRRSYTLVEVAVAFLVAVVVVGIAWTLWRMADKSFHSSRKRLTSLQGAFLLMERACNDLRRVYTDGGHPFKVVDRSHMEFHVLDPEETNLAAGTAEPVIGVRAMSYGHDASTGLFSWKDGPAQERVLRASPFECVLFFKPDQATPPTPEAEYVSFRITCTAEDDFEVNRGKSDKSEDRRSKEVVTLITAVGLEQRAGEAAFPWWKKNRLPDVKP
jgi:hypothetical protein